MEALIPDIPTIKERAIKKLERDLGPTILTALENQKTIEVVLNPDGKLWQECFGEPMKCIGEVDATRAESIIKTIAGYHSKEIRYQSPLFEGELPIDGSRFAGQLPPVVSAPTFAIRKKSSRLLTLEDYLESKVISESYYDHIIKAVKGRKNILITGGTGSGKTTLVNAVIEKII
jgi:type IV secretion system protein TrbB